jgi:hypothetical protein
MRAHWKIALCGTTVVAASIVACSSDPIPEDVGQADVAITNAPADASCLRITVEGSRTDVRSFPLSPGAKATFRLSALPVGTDTFSAEAFPVACGKINAGVTPTWISEPVTETIRAGKVSHVALLMIHNGGASVGVDFDDDNAPTAEPADGKCGGKLTAAQAYVVPVATGVVTVPIMTVGETVNAKPDGVTPYRMVGIPDGLGAFDNGDGTFTLLSNHELGATSGVARAHGGKGSFVSRWTMCQDDFSVLEGEDLIQSVFLWDAGTSAYVQSPNAAFGRFCSANLPERSALFDAASGLGYDGDIFFNGEESGSEGRGMAHVLDGRSYELPRTGKFSWENAVPAPRLGKTTVLVGLDDSTPGEVYFYYGTKTDTGSPVERAGLTNGTLYGLKVVGVAQENTAAGIPPSAVELAPLGNVESQTGAQLQTLSTALAVTKFNRPEDGAWDPNNKNDFYFVTTASFSAPSRLWRVSFVDATRPDLGGQIEMLLDGSEGQRMFDNARPVRPRLPAGRSGRKRPPGQGLALRHRDGRADAARPAQSGALHARRRRLHHERRGVVRHHRCVGHLRYRVVPARRAGAQGRQRRRRARRDGPIHRALRSRVGTLTGGAPCARRRCSLPRSSVRGCRAVRVRGTPLLALTPRAPTTPCARRSERTPSRRTPGTRTPRRASGRSASRAARSSQSRAPRRWRPRKGPGATRGIRTAGPSTCASTAGRSTAPSCSSTAGRSTKASWRPLPASGPPASSTTSPATRS